MDKDNPHTEFDDSSQVVYWKDGTACGANDAWTHAALTARGRFPELVFEREEADRLKQTRRLMQRAFSLGRTYQASEIRKAMNYQNGAV